jgi:hypothetical protein
MNKLHLDVDQLAVESFLTVPAERGTGTVHAAAATEIVNCPSGPSCDGEPSCFDTCYETCTCPTYGWDPTCGLTCFETC